MSDVSEEMKDTILDEYKTTIESSFEILQKMSEGLLISGRALGATAMEDIDMRRPKELSFRIFVDGVMNTQVSQINMAINEVEEKLLEATHRFDIFSALGDDAI